MDIYNMKPAWLAVVEETKESLGRDLSGEEVVSIWWETRNFSNVLGNMYKEQLQMKDSTNGNVLDLISDLIMDGMKY